jgi:predicted nucleotidyltransferase
VAVARLQSAQMNAAVAEDTIDRAGRALIDAASAPAKVILFGSRARGDANARSDFDFLVVERDVADRFAETVRLGRVLGRLLIPADVVVVSERYAEKWAPVSGTLVHEAMSQGQVIAES